MNTLHVGYITSRTPPDDVVKDENRIVDTRTPKKELNTGTRKNNLLISQVCLYDIMGINEMKQLSEETHGEKETYI